MEIKKRVYNIILNSKDTKSYTGTSNNAQYFVDFTTVTDAEALNSSYLVRFRIRSSSTITTYFTPSVTEVILNLGFSTCSLNISNRINSRTAGILSWQWESSAQTSYYFDTMITDNPPMYINNLSTTSVISFSIFDMLNLSLPNLTQNYICILSFEEQ